MNEDPIIKERSSGTAIATTRPWLGLFAVLVLIYFGSSWMRPLGTPDEPRYTEIPREMISSGDWLAPRLNGVLYFYKPPLFYWLEAFSYKVGGLNRLVLRFWPAFFALASCGICYWAGKRLFNRESGWWAALVLGTALIHFSLSQMIILDMAVSFFMSAALLCYLVAIRQPRGPDRRWCFWSFYALIALAVMTKGLMAIALPGAIIFLWFLLLNQWKQLRHLYLFSGGLIFLLIALPWHVLVAREHSEWFDFYIIHEHFERYLSNVSHRGQPFWFFFVILPVGMIPWIFFLPAALKETLKGGWKRRKENQEAWFLVIWSVFILLFFSISKSKLVPYILPALPPLAILIGTYLASLKNAGESGLKSLKRGARSTSLFLFIGAAAIPTAAYLLNQTGDLNAGSPLLFAFSSLACLIAGGWLWRSSTQNEGKIAERIAIAMMVVLFIFNPLAARFQPPALEPILRQLKTSAQADDQIFSFKEYFHEMPLYLDQLVGVVDHIPTEQSFGLEWEDLSDRYMKLQYLRRRWRELDRRIYIVMKTGGDEEKFTSRIREPFYEWKRDDFVVIYTNIPLKKESETIDP